MLLYKKCIAIFHFNIQKLQMIFSQGFSDLVGEVLPLFLNAATAGGGRRHFYLKRVRVRGPNLFRNAILVTDRECCTFYLLPHYNDAAKEALDKCKVIVYKSCGELSLLLQRTTCTLGRAQGCNFKQSKVCVTKLYIYNKNFAYSICLN